MAFAKKCKNTKLQTERADRQFGTNQANSEQCNRLNNTELSGIPNDTPEEDLEKVVIDICHDSGLETEPKVSVSLCL